MKRVFFFEFWNWTPHLETSLELAKRHLDAGDEVHYYFCGYDALYKEGVAMRSSLARLFRKTPERRGAELLTSDRFHFYPRVELERVQWDRPSAFASLGDLMAVTFEKYEVGLGAASSLVSFARHSEPDLAANRRLILSMLDSGVSAYMFVKKKLSQEHPDLVYTFNGRFCNYRAVVRAAEASAVPYLIHERGANKFRYSVWPFMPHDTRRQQVTIKAMWEEAKHSPASEDVARSFFVDRRRGFEQDWIPFTRKQTSGALPSLPSDKKVVTYFSSTDDEYVAVGDGYRWEHWPNQHQALLDVIDICRGNSGVVLVIRLHPHLAAKSRGERARWLSLPRGPNVLVVEPESEIDSYALVEASNVVVSAGSTLGIEAVFWARPSITLGPSPYSELGATYQPTGRAELQRLLEAERLSVEPTLAYPYGYFVATFGEAFRFYRPETLFSGRFLGVDLQPRSLPFRAARWGWRRVKPWFSR